MRIAMLGTRGVPASYGGFETAVEEVGKRLVARGHEVTVYTRPSTTKTKDREYLGMRLVPLAAIRRRPLETLSHSALATAHVVSRRKPDALILFNSANSPYLLALRARKIPVATHVDGLEWRRAKWGPGGRRFYRGAESLAVRYSDALIADAAGIADYYRDEFGARTELIAYGAPSVSPLRPELLPAGLQPNGYHLVVARLEPENHVLEVVTGYTSSEARLPLVVVGAAPYADEYTQRVMRAAQGDRRVILQGRVDDQEVLDQLYANALTYFHGHSVGGTNPSLLRAMGAGTAVIAYDVTFNREVLGGLGSFFSGPQDLRLRIEAAETAPSDQISKGAALATRAKERYDWESVAGQYEELCAALAVGYSNYRRCSGRRNPASGWQ